MLKIGDRCVFQSSSADMISLTGYGSHNNMEVIITDIFCRGHLTFYEIKADDGWLGEAWHDELVQLQKQKRA